MRAMKALRQVIDITDLIAKLQMSSLGKGLPLVMFDSSFSFKCSYEAPTQSWIRLGHETQAETIKGLKPLLRCVMALKLQIEAISIGAISAVVNNSA